MALWLFRLLLLLAILVNAALVAMWVFGLYLFLVVATGSAVDPESQRWASSAVVFLAISIVLIGLGIFGIIKGWKLSKQGQLGKAARWIGVPMLLQVSVMVLS